MIVAHHFSVHGGFPYTNEHLLNKGFLVLFGSGGKIGVNVFVLISGYFLVATKFSLKKLARYVMQIWSYSAAILGVALLFNLSSVSTKEIVRYLLPLGYMNWFAHTYLLMFLLTPFINVMLTNFDKLLYKRFLVLGFSLWYLIPTVTGLVGMRLDMGASILMDFIFLYALGAYIRLHYTENHIKYCLIKAVSLYIAIVFLDILATLIKVKYIKGNLFYFADMNSALALIASVYMFLAFKQLNIAHNKFINAVAGTTFGVYLLHDSNLLRKFIWHDALNVKQFYTSDFLPVYAVMSVILVFVICALIDFLRIRFLEVHYVRWINKSDILSHFVKVLAKP